MSWELGSYKNEFSKKHNNNNRDNSGIRACRCISEPYGASNNGARICKSESYDVDG